MTNEKLKEIAYAAGWVEGRLEEDVQNVEDEDERKHRQEMLDAFLIVSNALDELRRENTDLSLRMAQAGSFLNR